MIVVITPKTKEHFEAYYALRYRVLRQPWGQAKGSEKDDYEPISDHFMAVDDQSGEVYGVVKLFEKEPGVAQLSHLAVIKPKQGTGVGKLLLETVENAARQKGYKKIGAMSRLSTTDFFDIHGYTITGVPSLHFSTIELVWMEKKLEPETDQDVSPDSRG